MDWYRRLEQALSVLRHLQAFKTLPEQDHVDLDTAILALEAVLARENK